MGDPAQDAALRAETRPLLEVPVRTLSDDDAFDLMMDLVELGEFKLYDKIVTDKFDNITSHRPGQQTRIIPVMAGLPFLKAKGNNREVNGSAGAVQQTYFAPTPNFAIVLYKLAKLLIDDWDAKQVVYGGIGVGGNAAVTDCHSTGHCVDFYGADTKRGNFDVRRDWWARPVFDSAGNEHPSDGKGWAQDKWKNETNTYYRLAMSPDAKDLAAAEFFAAIYEFAHSETRAEAFDINPLEFSSGIKLRRGFIMHPDYPKKDTPGRESHNDHIHFQLGNTR